MCECVCVCVCVCVCACACGEREGERERERERLSKRVRRLRDSWREREGAVKSLMMEMMVVSVSSEVWGRGGLMGGGGGSCMG